MGNWKIFDKTEVSCWAAYFCNVIIENQIEGLAQDCNNSSALAMELLQSCARPLTFRFSYHILFSNVNCDKK